jgi:hypothetical protein
MSLQCIFFRGGVFNVEAQITFLHQFGKLVGPISSKAAFEFMLLFVPYTWYSLVKGERIVHFVLSMQLCAFEFMV